MMQLMNNRHGTEASDFWCRRLELDGLHATPSTDTRGAASGVTSELNVIGLVGTVDQCDAVQGVDETHGVVNVSGLFGGCNRQNQ